MTTRTIALATAAAIAAALLAGCTTTPSGMPGTGMGPNVSSSPEASPSPSSDAHNNADLMFTMMMIPHHEQAVEMADMIIGKTGIDPKITALAQKIKDAQQPEITQMEGWLDTWGVGDANDMMDDMDHGTGMMSDGDMSELESAAGDGAGRVFLNQMIEHHEGAIDMATDEVEDGQNPDTVALANNITTSQTAEIAVMKGLLSAG
ncbi:DUF305 domain-containing protein [Cryobacterium sp. PAMC25264]|uniref:DUF305 domain-containing protein n=1 Tax=Cryobacterium sp. PAMC25264 TaxID=2861288 RepID=UPI001C630589|nr:DUF305 domain-containing protein [Cryobacterium sp. PAMC25264]QYF74443.1 DUF305 domain-containing protein [Cryobacterium sp. PAMC25264]